MIFLHLAGYILFMVAISYYLITNLQWYSYRIQRVLFHHTKSWWHIVYFIIPFVLYVGANYLGGYGYGIALLYVGVLFLWYRGLDKPLVWTGRVKRFMGIVFLVSLFMALAFEVYTVLIPLTVGYILSLFFEKIAFDGFKKQAAQKLNSMENLIVVGITASYGKTSIKNYIAHLLQATYRTYATPRSVNTLGGIMKDVNDDLPADTEIYVVEMEPEGSVISLRSLPL